MKLPLEVVDRGAALPAWAREEIASHAERLDRFCGRIMRCRVTVEGPAPHHAHGAWSAKVDLTVPGREIVVSRPRSVGLREALRDVFGAAARRLEDYVRRRRGFVKTHAT